MSYADASGTEVSRCATCNLTFSTRASRREHFDSAFHLDNLKRVVNGAPALTSTQWQMSLNIKQSVAASTRASSRAFYCKVCKKLFGTSQTMDAHLKSAAHKATAAAATATDPPSSSDTPSTACPPMELAPEPSDPSAVRALRQTTLGPLDCLLCNLTTFSSTDALLDHMKSAHSFHIPFESYVTDMEGLLRYCAEKVESGMCLACTRSFDSLLAVRDHMLKVGHGRIMYFAKPSGYSDLNAAMHRHADAPAFEYAEFGNFPPSGITPLPGGVVISAAEAGAPASIDLGDGTVSYSRFAAAPSVNVGGIECNGRLYTHAMIEGPPEGGIAGLIEGSSDPSAVHAARGTVARSDRPKGALYCGRVMAPAVGSIQQQRQQVKAELLKLRAAQELHLKAQLASNPGLFHGY